MECKHAYNFRIQDGDKVVVCKPNGTYIRKNADEVPGSLIDTGVVFAERDSCDEKGVKAIIVPMDTDETLDFIDNFNKVRAKNGWAPLVLLGSR